MAIPTELLTTLFALAILPVVLLSATSFLKLSVIFGILRNAIGMQGVPSATVTASLALALSTYQMIPVAQGVMQKLTDQRNESFAKIGKQLKVGTIDVASVDLSGIIEPLESYLRPRANMRERVFFARHTKAGSPAPNVDAIDPHSHINGESLLTLLPAYMVSELHRAFAVGFLLYLPFLVIDLVVAHILVVIGMSMVNPIQLALPLKLGLFVLCDGWFSLVRGLIEG